MDTIKEQNLERSFVVLMSIIRIFSAPIGVFVFGLGFFIIAMWFAMHILSGIALATIVATHSMFRIDVPDYDDIFAGVCLGYAVLAAFSVMLTFVMRWFRPEIPGLGTTAALASAPYASMAITQLFPDAQYFSSVHSGVSVFQAWLYWLDQSQSLLTLDFPGIEGFPISPLQGIGWATYHLWFVKVIVYGEFVGWARSANEQVQKAMQKSNPSSA